MCEVKRGFPVRNDVEIFLIKRRTYMAGTKAGGMKAAAANKAKDPDFYAKIGAKGGQNGSHWWIRSKP